MVIWTIPCYALIEMLRADPVVIHYVGQVEIYGRKIPAITGEIDGAVGLDIMPRRFDPGDAKQERLGA